MADLEKLGKYDIRRELGRGAMGIVYEGYDEMIKRIVALKTIRADQLQGENPDAAIARFRREAQAAGRLSHPNIVSIYDFGEENGTWYIAMEYVNGRELKDYFQANERFATSDIVRIMTQILSALDYSHKQGVVHRDIKPANVIILPDGSVKVADFGIAHIETSNMTQLGAALGTPAYMSPEQIQGLPVDGRSDLFSAGVILYQFLTGERPFMGTTTVTMRKVLEENPLPPSRFNVQVPPEMDTVVQMALAKRPEDRFQNAKAFITALHNAAQSIAPGESAAVAMNAPASSPAVLEPTVIAAAPPAATATRTASPPPIPPMPPGGGRPAAGATPAAPGVPAYSGGSKQTSAVVIVVAVVAIALGAGGWFGYNWFTHRDGGEVAKAGGGAPATVAKADTAAPAPAPIPAPARKDPPGKLTISAVGWVDPSDTRYQADKALAQTDLRADSKNQVVEKAIGMLLDRKSLDQNYDVVKNKLLSRSDEFVTVMQESAPSVDKDGLMSMTTQAVVNVKAVQKSLDDMSREERVQLIRATGDPKVAVKITVRDAEQPDAPPMPSPIAENVLKERIKSFGFRTWSDEGGRSEEARKGADFDVLGEAKIKKLSMRLQASGLTITKYALTSYSVKAVDRESGEEIYYNTQLPKGIDSFATEEDALRAIGGKVADEFSRDFFLAHVNPQGQRVVLNFSGLPKSVSDDKLQRELLGLPSVIAATPAGKGHSYDVTLAGSRAPGDEVASGVVKPLNSKMGQPCFALGGASGEQVTVAFDKKCDDPSVLSRLDTNPPAGLYSAPPSRQRSLIKSPELLRKLMT